MQLATLAIALLALIVSCLSLAWQMFSFSRSGRKVRTYVSVGWRGAGTQLLLQSVKRREDLLDQLSRLSGHGPSTPVLGVTVHNVGRSDLYVSAVFFTSGSRTNTFFPAAGPSWPTFPHLLRSGDGENWYLDTAEFRDICQGWGILNGTGKGELAVRVTLKDGRTIRVPRRIKVEELRRIWNVAHA